MVPKKPYSTYRNSSPDSLRTDRFAAYKVKGVYFMSHNEFKICVNNFYKAFLSELDDKHH